MLSDTNSNNASLSQKQTPVADVNWHRDDTAACFAAGPFSKTVPISHLDKKTWENSIV